MYLPPKKKVIKPKHVFCISLDNKVCVFLSKTFINTTHSVVLVDDFQLLKERLSIESFYIYLGEPS